MSAPERKPQQATPPKPAFNAGDEEQVAERTRNAKNRDARAIAGLRKIVDDPESRLWLWELLAFCGISKSSFTGNSTTFFNEGQRNVGLRIQAELVKNCPDAYLTMMKESENAS